MAGQDALGSTESTSRPLTGLSGSPLSLESVTQRYGRGKQESAVDAVRAVSFDVAAGELLTVLGPSGAGKSTILRVIAGLEIPREGRVILGGKDITRVTPQKRNIGVVFQNYALFPHMTVAENIAFGLRVRKVPATEIAQRVQEVLGLVQLQGYEGRHPSKLSGGQQQRVAIARTLVYRPHLLLMDEPLGALDRALRDHLQTELRMLQQRLGITCVYVTHDQDEAMALSDRIAVIHDGVLQQIGHPQELYENPNSEFVANFFGRLNAFSATVTEHRPDETVVTIESSNVALVVAGSHGTRGQHLRIGVRPERIRVRTAQDDDEHRRSGTQSVMHNRLRARVVNERYAGSSRYLLVQLGDLQLTVQRTGGAGDHSPSSYANDTIELGIDATDLLVLKE